MRSVSPYYARSSGNTFYFRSQIPSDLRDHFGGRKQFKISLKCSLSSRSEKIIKSLNSTLSKLYDQIRQGMKELTLDDIKEILRIEIRKQILHAHHVNLGTNKFSETRKQMSLDSVNQREMFFMDTLKNDMRTHQQELDVKLEAIFNSLDIEFKSDSVPYKSLRSYFTELYILRFQWMKELIELTGKSDDDFRRDAQTKLGLELFPELSDHSSLNQIDIKTTAIPEPIKTSISPLKNNTSDQSLTLSSATYFDRKKIGGIAQKSIESDKSIIREFIEIVGDMDFSMLTKKQVSHYIDVQTKLPPNRTKSPKYRSLSIQEIVLLDLPNKETQNPLNINKKLTKLTSFGNWGVRQGLLQSNPFRDMKLSIKKGRTERKPFTLPELKKILKPETYLDNTVHFKHPIHNYGGAKLGNAYYWVFILGIFSGLRTNEMAQMRLEDIKKESNIWFLHVEDSEQTNVKTANAIRKVPVHPQLMELGFIDHVTSLRKQKKDRLFWELTKTRDGYAKQLSRHFNEKYLRAVGVWERNVKVLYCTRHTFVNALYQNKVDENVIKALVGHEKEFIMKHYGGEPFSPDRLLQEISKVNYKGIKWDRLKI